MENISHFSFIHSTCVFALISAVIEDPQFTDTIENITVSSHFPLTIALIDILLFLSCFSFFLLLNFLAQHKKSNETTWKLQVPAGRNVKLACSVKNLGSYKVSSNLNSLFYFILNNNYFSISTTHFSLPFHKFPIEFLYIFIPSHCRALALVEHLKTLISFCRAFTNRFCVFVDFFALVESRSLLYRHTRLKAGNWKVWKVKHKDFLCTTYNNVFVNKSINCLLSLIFFSASLHSSPKSLLDFSTSAPLYCCWWLLSLFSIHTVFSWILC